MDPTLPGMKGDVAWGTGDHSESFWVDFERSLHLRKEATVVIYCYDRIFKTHFYK